MHPGYFTKCLFSFFNSGGSAICESALSRLTTTNQEKSSSPSGSLVMSDHPSLQSSSSSPDIISTKTPGVSFCSFANARQSLHGAIPLMSPSVSMPGALGLPAAWLQYSLYPPPTAAGADPRALGLAEYHHQLKQAGLPTDLSYLKYKAPLMNRNYLELAMLVCNTFRGKLFPCPHCRYVTDRRNNLKRHISTMHQACDKVLECCGVTFSTKASLREHIMIFHHNGYSCPFCGRRFCRKALLRRHLSVHNGQKDYNCPHCDYATSHKSNLERHKRIHERLKINEPAASLLPRNLSTHSSSSDSSTHVTVGTTENCPNECDSGNCSQIPDTTVMPGSSSSSVGDFDENSPIPLLTTGGRRSSPPARDRINTCSVSRNQEWTICLPFFLFLFPLLQFPFIYNCNWRI